MYAAQMETELKAQKTLGGILKVLTKYYDVDNCEVGNIMKSQLLPKLGNLVNATRCKAKKEFQ
jgi:hypothetical protein